MLLPTLVAAVALFSLPVESKTRTFYLAAVEIDWDYAPFGNLVNTDTLNSDPYLKHGTDRIGSVYRKIVYRQFTDGSFTQQMPSPPAHGMVGPLMRAETGDTMEIIFKNMVTNTNRSFSVHPHGVQYNKDAEGALYVDQTTGTDKDDDGVPPGHTFRYVWRVLPAFAPTYEDDSCLPWAYHSHVASTKDVDSGLIGVMLTCKPGTLARGGPRKDQRKDVDAEFPIYLDDTDENNSWLFHTNIPRCGDPSACSSLSAAADRGFINSNRMSHVNGRVFGNLEGLDVTVYQRPVFYFFSLNHGTHAAHFSGQVLTVREQSVDSVNIFPATFVAGVMFPTYPGHWLLASRNADTYAAGMQAYITVRPKFQGPFGRKRRAAILDSAENLDSSNVDSAVDSALEVPRHRRQAENGLPHARGRRYYLGIEDYVWDYGPSGQDLYGGGPLGASGSPSFDYFNQGPDRIGGRYKKSRYVLYSDSSFTTRVPRDASHEHLGMLGPLLKAEVGETVEVRVKNMADRPYSFLPHGVQFDKVYEGFVYRNPDTNQLEGRVVNPNEIVTYRFKVPALGHDDLPCVTRTYHSAVDPTKDINTGLIGPLMLCNRGQLDNSSPLNRGRGNGRSNSKHWFHNHQHFFLNFFTVDENLSWHVQHNIDTYTTDPGNVDVNDAGFRASNRRHAINGYMYGNLEGLNVCLGDDVAWHLFGVGGLFDNHGVNFQGQTLELTGNHINAKLIMPGTALTMTSEPDTVGNWSVACRTNFHFIAGMTAKYEVSACGESETLPPLDGVTRRYYVAAEEMLWEYAPLKRDLVTGLPLTDESQKGYLYVKDTDDFIGSVYKKVRYIEYTDATFSTVKVRPPHEEHLGILGPILRAEVGDTIEVVFHNKASRPYSMHPQGVQYTKDNEGANYVDGTGGSAGDSVGPNQSYTYTWRVPERAGPGKNDPGCIAWMYYSSVNSVRDMSSGLVGPLLICDRYTLSPGPESSASSDGLFQEVLQYFLNNHLQGQSLDSILGGSSITDLLSGTSSSTSTSTSMSPRSDVDREFWMLYFKFDENDSWYLDENVAERAPNRTNLKDPEFMDSNLMNAINGLIYGNVEGMVMKEGDVVAWYLLGLGNTFDYHPVHFHGQTFTHRTERTHRGDVLEVFPSTSSVVTMVCDNPGTWLVHCHLSNHVRAGMEATYTILPAE